MHLVIKWKRGNKSAASRSQFPPPFAFDNRLITGNDFLQVATARRCATTYSGAVRGDSWRSDPSGGGGVSSELRHLSNTRTLTKV